MHNGDSVGYVFRAHKKLRALGLKAEEYLDNETTHNRDAADGGVPPYSTGASAVGCFRHVTHGCRKAQLWLDVQRYLRQECPCNVLHKLRRREVSCVRLRGALGVPLRGQR